MKSLTLVFLAVSAISAHAGVRTVMSCSTPVGPDQSIEIKADGPKLTLIETSMDGVERTREIPPAEWESHEIQLRDQDGFKTLLKIAGKGDVWVTTTDGSFTESGPADCRNW